MNKPNSYNVTLKIQPTELKNPKMVVYSKSAMSLLDLDSEQLEVNTFEL